MSNIDFEIKGIGKFIKENNLKVPIYQRPFAWGDKQVEELINDIKESINEDEYFLGTIVLTKIEGESKLEIVDGQQRISSIIIFFSALRKHLIDSKKSTSKIQSDYLSEYNMREKANIPKLELSSQDNEFFREFIVNDNGKFRDELLNCEIFETLFEAKVLIERWRKEYNTFRPHSALGYLPPAPETVEAIQIVGA